MTRPRAHILLAVAEKATFEYRIVWKRAGLRPKRKRYASLRAVERFVGLLGPEPWLYLGRNPDSYECCNGRECGCGGLTVREAQAEYIKDAPAIEYIKVERREVGAWEQKS